MATRRSKTNLVNPPPRCERKYVLENITLPEILCSLKIHPAVFLEEYPPRNVFNLYLDSSDFTFFQASVDGLAERLKIRFRWYGSFMIQKRLNLEVKRKVDTLIYKYLIPLNFKKKTSPQFLLSHYQYLDFSPLPKHTIQSLQPTLFNCYQRKYFVNANKHVRLTLDFNLLSQRIFSKNQILSSCSARRNNFAPILELKYPPEFEAEAEAITNHLPIIITKHSKYVEGFLTASPF